MRKKQLEATALFRPVSGRKARAALFLSGGGSNAEKILEFCRKTETAFEIAVVVTDCPRQSAAAALAERFGKPFAALDLREFYAKNGETEIRLNTPERRALRDRWSEELRQLIEPFAPDFGILAGFVPLSNIVTKLPCLNVHPGDLTIEENGVRIFAGLHYLPVEKAMLYPQEALRSSVILAQAYCGSGKAEMDSGPVLGVSAPVPVDLAGHTVDELRQIRDARKQPPHDDLLRELAKSNVERLKREGDHVVFSRCIDLFARGRYGLAGKQLCFLDDGGRWLPVTTVEFRADGGCSPVPAKESALKKRLPGILRGLKLLYTKMVRESGSPDYIARGWAIGMFVGCVIPVFCQLIVAIPLSFLFRGSKIGAAAGTFITTPPTAVFIYPVQCYVGNKVLGGALTVAGIRQALAGFLDKPDYQSFATIGKELIAAFFVGGLLWAAVMTPLTYFGVRFLVIRYRNFREARRMALIQRAGK